MRTTFLKFKLGLIYIFPIILLSACDSSVIPVEHNGCVWIDDSIGAKFIQANFCIPVEDCKMSFDKNCLQGITDIDGVFNFMHEVATNCIVDSCKLTWLSSIYTKKCDNNDLDANNERLQLDLNNYYTRLFPSDVIERVPIVHHDCNMVPENYKHQLIIQIPGVANTLVGNVGTLTWINTWLGENHAPFHESIHRWDYHCHSPMYATFTPDYGCQRNVYVYYQFELIY